MSAPPVPATTWAPPPPRTGPAGAWDRLVGPGQTRAELALTLVPSIVAAAAVAAAMAVGAGGFSAVEVVVAAVIAFDVVGGVVANASTAGQRWYHRPGTTRAELLGFVALHAVHVLAVGLLFLDDGLAFFAVVFGVLMVGAVATVAVPLYLQRPVALVGFMAGTGLGLGLFALPAELAWFVPLLLCKLLVSHVTRHAPFAPPPASRGTGAARSS